MSILLLEDILAFLGKSDPTAAEQSRIELLQPMVERALRRVVGSSIEQQTFVHLLPAANIAPPAERFIDAVSRPPAHPFGNDPAVLILPERPVRSITEIREDQTGTRVTPSDFDDATLLTADDDYHLDLAQAGFSTTGRLIRRNGNWPRRPRSMRVTYIAGYTADELAGNASDPALDASDIKLAALFAMRHAFATAGTSQLQPKSERLGDYTVDYGDISSFALPNEALELLRPFASYEL